MTSAPTRPVDNVVIATKDLQDRNINILAGTTVENKGKLILKEHIYLMVFTFSYKILPILICSFAIMPWRRPPSMLLIVFLVFIVKPIYVI